jgi:hypothetical protein
MLVSSSIVEIAAVSRNNVTCVAWNHLAQCIAAS